MKILLVTNKFFVEDGGSYTAISELCYALNNKKGIFAKIVHNNNSFLNPITCRIIISNFDIIHIFGIWSPFSNMIIYLARKMKKVIIVSPIGYLEKWSLQQSKIKKLIAWHLYQKKLLENCDYIHVTSEQELESLKKNNLKNVKLIFIPHGKINKIYSDIEVLEKNKKNRTVLFFSRIHKKKGLLELIEAWNFLKPHDWQLDITGPVTDMNYKKKLQRKISQYNLNQKIFFSNPIFDEYSKKLKLYKADLVILPSRNENFAFSICEAMLASRVVLCSSETPWDRINAIGAGYCLPLNTKDEIILALKRILKLKNNELSIIGNKAKNFALSNYDLDNVVIDKYIKFYKSLIMQL